MRYSLNRFILPILAPIGLIILWQVASIKVQNEVVLPSVSQVAAVLSRPNDDLLRMGSIVANLWVSFFRVMGGYLLGLLLALPVGVLMGHYRTVNRLLGSLVEMLRPMPPLAWIPLVLAWFGVASLATTVGVEEGTWYPLLNNIKYSMLFIIFIGSFFPILINTVHGVSGVRSTLIDSARVLGASERDIFLKILLPAAAPSIVTGMRLGLGGAWMCLVAAEMMPGSISGVGYLITHAYTVAGTDIVMAGMISIGMIGIVIDGTFRFFEDRYFSWQRLSR
ncbi:ABC transporter permease [Dethiosulfovibrio salsuginis]|uniref:NitT/TauT family transport system permease protein n=1 Tax=Dethiosulfovibrio salsuginis TaxID=561720 RepID=A0A1X7LC68_9BACT|nr:ABC transporter permease [Dethiosulfovibrio salsuginis]SMG51436.1 NitT/TauT family transport system permease protein [Dethiosulfovibrio salsuginis]